MERERPEATGCLRCYFIGTPEQFEAHECPDILSKVRLQGQQLANKENAVDKQQLRDDLLFLRGLIQGISFFTESNNMGHAMESAEDQLQSISNRILKLIEPAPSLNSWGIASEIPVSNGGRCHE
jgi:hypothetical protein